MLAGISIFCFAASYIVAWLLEMSRLFFRSGIRGAVMMGFAVAGLVAHTLYLVAQVVYHAPGNAPLSSWADWLLVAAWTMVLLYLYLEFYHPKNPIGLFALPLVLALIGVAAVIDDRPFPPAQASKIWGMIHGIALLIGAVVVMFGFLAGVMYLLQSYRLKHKMPPSDRFKLPSLEWLENVNARSIVVSLLFVGAGVLSGWVLNVAIAAGSPNDAAALRWNDPVVWSSGLLFGWLLAAWLFSLFYRPARRGRKVAYLTLASFGFLLLALGVVLWAPSSHPSAVERGNRNNAATPPALSAPAAALPGSPDGGAA